MKTNFALISLLLIIFTSCSTPGYLPTSYAIDVNEYGSYIKIIQKSASKIKGELIAIDNNRIIVMVAETRKCKIVSLNDVNHFKLRYAKPKHYGWTIPAFIVYPLIHGYYSIASIPIHLIVTISVTVSGESAFMYSDKNMTYEKLKMFARFPQGIPPNVDVASLK
ncbi:MAG: hypothetical protein IPG39_16865 [Bacteroidetes bacterium]|nr:hypothetical protein [Bacteroidota bacterium]